MPPVREPPRAGPAGIQVPASAPRRGQLTEPLESVAVRLYVFATVSTETFPPSDKLRELLRGFPESTLRDCAEYQATATPEAFERAFSGVITHHLNPAPLQPVASLPGSTTLTGDLGLDSLTMIEMMFLFEDLCSAKLPHEELAKVVTLDDLRRVLHAHASPPARSA